MQFKKVEEKVLVDQESKEVQSQFKTNRYNEQAIKIEWSKVAEDRRKKEWIIYGPREDRQIGRIVKKKEKKI